MPGWAGFTAARTRAISSLHGRVLEIGAGRGANFTALSPGVTWTGLEPSRRLRDQLAGAARRHGHHAPPMAAAAEGIPLPAASVDAVLGTTVLCSVRDQAQVLAEIARVLVPGGVVVLTEHVVAAPGTFARTVQHLVRPVTRLVDHGCDPTRDTERAVIDSALRLDTVSRHDVSVLGRRLAMPFLVLTATKLAEA